MPSTEPPAGLVALDDVEAFRAAIEGLDRAGFDPAAAVRNAERFSAEAFRRGGLDAQVGAGARREGRAGSEGREGPRGPAPSAGPRPEPWHQAPGPTLPEPWHQAPARPHVSPCTERRPDPNTPPSRLRRRWRARDPAHMRAGRGPEREGIGRGAGASRREADRRAGGAGPSDRLLSASAVRELAAASAGACRTSPSWQGRPRDGATTAGTAAARSRSS